MSNEPAPNPTYDQLRAVVWKLHDEAEVQSLALHRQLHDDFGGLIVSAAMDLAALSADLPAKGPFEHRLRRAHQAMIFAVDLERSLSEGLRPSLLDNIGLFAALRWHTRQAFTASLAVCSEHYPDKEMSLAPAAMTTLYRIAQETLALVLREPDLKKVDVAAEVEDKSLELTIAYEYKAIEPLDMFSTMPVRMHSVCERTRSLRGQMRTARSDNAIVLIHRFPIDRITA